ncbi:hypothetical protein GP486_004493 [Trichoglossum hirsutum]|uniref:Uncharacterized protein n=1 Tax=Trichoglossum hirsutum TaxID=265104 RepID=A0A9P8LBA0_9PEZI|nr:hypothetical protein GP486_004493 [Trichoglossum hirsutum]
MSGNNGSRKTERKRSVVLALTNSLAPPAIRLTNPAAEFIDTQLDFGPEYTISNPAVRFDPHQDKFTTEPTSLESIYHAATEEKDRFLAAMAEYEKTAKPALKTNINIRGKHSWDDVISEARRAEAKYKQSSAVRCCFRKIGSNTSALNEWLGLLPTTAVSSGSSYTSIFCGGFQLILSAATRIDDLRELTFESLTQIPEIIQSARIYASEYKSPKLHQRNADLYAGVLGLLEHILAWYQQKATTKAFKAVLKQGSYEKELGEKVKNVKSLAELVKDEVAFCGHLRLGRVNETVNRIEEKFEGFDRFEKSELQQTHTSIIPATWLMNDKMVVLQAVYETFCSNLEQHYWREKMWEVRLEKQRELLKFKEGLSRSPSPTNGPQGISRRKLLRILPFQPRIPPSDILTALQYGRNLPLAQQDRAEYIMRSATLKTWITSPDSQPLILNGNAEYEVISCVSFVSAMLVRALQDVCGESIMVVSHFCALHRKEEDVHAGPVGMAGSLVGQLLVQYRGFDFSFYRRSQNASLADGDPCALTTLLTELIRQLPPKTAFFCVIDSVSSYEGSNLRHDTCKIVKELLQLTEHPTDASVKVLVTSPGRCGYVHRGVDRGDVFEVPEFVDGERQGLSDGRWDCVKGGVEELQRSIAEECDEEVEDSEED